MEDTFGLVGRVVAGRYAVERVAARGGFGLVYRAVHVELSAPVALKVLVIPPEARGSADADHVERFRREARTLAALKHPAIVRVLDVGTLDSADPSCVWMALEWIDGATLEDDLQAREGRGRTPRETLSLLAPAFDAVASAHAKGVAHRDLKPANLMLSPAAEGLRVLDFGIAKEMLPEEAPGSGRTETRSELAMFSLQHAAPEQVGRARTGPWTDVHALGLLVTETLAGRRAYRGESSFELYAAVMSPVRPSPATLGLDVGPWEPLLCRALALHPAERFADAGEFYAALAASVDEADRPSDRSHLAATVAAASDIAAPSGRSRTRIVRIAVALVVSGLATASGFRIARSVRPRAVVRTPTVERVVPTPVPTPVRAPSFVEPAVAAVPPDVPAVPSAAQLPRAPLRPAPTRPRVPPRPPVRAFPGDADPDLVVE